MQFDFFNLKKKFEIYKFEKYKILEFFVFLKKKMPN